MILIEQTICNTVMYIIVIFLINIIINVNLLFIVLEEVIPDTTEIKEELVSDINGIKEELVSGINGIKEELIEKS